ncbi:aryl-alcohol dehydrogenase-like predicted oxidoreductase [Virgibacillus halotolerans]|uniref:aldo/keto reductase n=1 Tax=Virgibacillus halotolerans TaxID=1071053 RepID=UPI00196096F8|nr:aldo/keto reductase [Virgibacillus halotolerans]MBM7601512.1 aryl-alcohol dehydrogenase-like predicted oxidoreductase [Virgibacillus halotolerans]
MEYRVLGRTGLKVSSFVLGTGTFGFWGNNTEIEVAPILDEALAEGINLIDTADVYSSGQSEEILGKLLKGRRQDVILGTKGGKPMGSGQNQSGNSKYWIRKAVEDSLRRLQTDYIDLYQLHEPDLNTDIEETLSVLTDLVTEGKIRYIGTSNFQAWQVTEAQWISERKNVARFISEQSPYSILNRSIEFDLLAATAKYGMGVMVWSPLSGGLLTGKYGFGEAVPSNSRAATFAGNLQSIVDPNREENRLKFEAITKLQTLANKVGMTLPHLAMAFTQAYPCITSAIIGPRTLEQLRETLKGKDIRLSNDILDEIDSIVPPGITLDTMERGWAPGWLQANKRRVLR